MGWLSGWQYRKLINVEGASGAGENYTLQTRVVWNQTKISLSKYNSGFTTEIWFSDKDSNGNIYVITAGFDGTGTEILYKSTDSGKTFTLSYNFGANKGATACGGLFIDSRDYIYVSCKHATGNNKVYRSTDGGTTFSDVYIFGSPYEFIWGMTEDANGNLYIGVYTNGDAGNTAYAKMLKSTDEGVSFTVKKTWDARHVHAIYINPFNDWLYVNVGENHTGGTEGDHIYRSKDGGDTWYLLTDGHMIPIFGFGNSATIYTGTDNHGGGLNNMIYRFTDDGRMSGGTISLTLVYTFSGVYAQLPVYGACQESLEGFLVTGTAGTTSGYRPCLVISKTGDSGSWTILDETPSLGYNRMGFALSLHPQRGSKDISAYCASASLNRRIILTDINIEEHAQPDFDDIRFTDDNGTTLLPTWRYSKTDSDNAIIFVKVFDDLSSNQLIYIYYGKSDASLEDDGENTFPLLYEDFEAGTVGQPPVGWSENEAYASGTYIVSNEQAKDGTKSCKCDCDGGSYYQVLSPNIGVNYDVEIIMHVYFTATNLWSRATSSAWDQGTFLIAFNSGGQRSYWRGGTFVVTGTYTTGWHEIKVRLYFATKKFGWDYDGVNQAEDGDFYLNTANLNSLLFAPWNYNIIYIDRITVRKKLLSEPFFINIGTEELAIHLSLDETFAIEAFLTLYKLEYFTETLTLDGFIRSPRVQWLYENLALDRLLSKYFVRSALLESLSINDLLSNIGFYWTQSLEEMLVLIDPLVRYVFGKGLLGILGIQPSFKTKVSKTFPESLNLVDVMTRLAKYRFLSELLNLALKIVYNKISIPILFSTGWETGNSMRWSVKGAEWNEAYISNVGGHHGTYLLDISRTWGDAPTSYLQKNIQINPPIAVKVWFSPVSIVDQPRPAFLAIYLQGNALVSWGVNYERKNIGYVVAAWDGGSTSFYIDPNPMTWGSWHSAEIYIVSTNEVRFYLDGVLKTTITGYSLPGPTIGIRTGLFITLASDTGSFRYKIDCFSVSTEHLGIAGDPPAPEKGVLQILYLIGLPLFKIKILTKESLLLIPLIRKLFGKVSFREMWFQEKIIKKTSRKLIEGMRLDPFISFKTFLRLVERLRISSVSVPCIFPVLLRVMVKLLTRRKEIRERKEGSG